MENAQAKVTEAQKAYDEAVKKEAEAEAQIAKGSLGFFESVGATEAAAVFSDEKYEEELQYTHMGEEGDATSLENMKASLDYIKECNDIRVNEEKVDPLTGEPCEELMVNDYLMATSQVSANVAAHKAEDEGVYGHSGVAPAGEILAYNYDDPYDG